MTSSSVLDVNPDIPECHTLRGWFDAGGNSENFQSHTNTYSGGGAAATFNRSELMSLDEVKQKELGSSDKVDYFSTRATVMHLKQENIAYPACPTQGCNKKVFDQHDGWRCEKCDRSFEKPEYRFEPCSLTVHDDFADLTTSLDTSYPWLYPTTLAKHGSKASTIWAKYYSSVQQMNS